MGQAGRQLAAALVCLLWGGAAGSAIVPVPPGKLVATGDDGLYVPQYQWDGHAADHAQRVRLGSGVVAGIAHGSCLSGSPARATLMIVGSDGSGLRVLSDDVALAPMPRWSPDGKRLAYGGCGGICVLDLVTGARKSFLSGPETVGVDWLARRQAHRLRWHRRAQRRQRPDECTDDHRAALSRRWRVASRMVG